MYHRELDVALVVVDLTRWWGVNMRALGGDKKR